MTPEILSKVYKILHEAEVPERHTYYQLKNFIIGKECTIQGQLWQVVRELRARSDSLEAIRQQVEDLEDNIELADIWIGRTTEDLNKAESEWDIREITVLIRKKEREKANLEHAKEQLLIKQKYLIEEITYFVSAFEVISKAEPLKPLDDINAQRNYWSEKYQEELNLRMLFGHPLDSDFVRSVLSLDENSPVRIQMESIIKNMQNRIILERHRQKAAESKINELRGIPAEGTGENHVESNIIT